MFVAFLGDTELSWAFLPSTDWPQKKIHVPRRPLSGTSAWEGGHGCCPILFLWHPHHLAFSDPKAGDFPSKVKGSKCLRGPPDPAVIFLPLTSSPAIFCSKNLADGSGDNLSSKVSIFVLLESIRSGGANGREILLVFFPISVMLAYETWKWARSKDTEEEGIVP